MGVGPSVGLWEDLDPPISMAACSPSCPPSIGFFLFLLDRRLKVKVCGEEGRVMGGGGEGDGRRGG